MDWRDWLKVAGSVTALLAFSAFRQDSLLAAQNPPTKAQTQRDFEILLPRDYTPEKRYTLIFCLHPNGRGQDYIRVLQQLARESHCIVAASNKYRNGQQFSEFVPEVVRAVEEIKNSLSVKADRIFLCGLSGGGMAAYVACHQNPDLFAGVIVNDGSVHPSVLNSEGEKKTTIRKAALISGKKDKIIPPEIMQRDAELLEKTGTKAKILTFSGAHTFAPVALYRQALDWLESD